MDIADAVEVLKSHGLFASPRGIGEPSAYIVVGSGITEHEGIRVIEDSFVIQARSGHWVIGEPAAPHFSVEATFDTLAAAVDFALQRHAKGSSRSG